ncbi:MAG: hypothetical protein IKV41_05110 [Oscillospiraceae bacterium]|nr:hypothetical protein [Oscillospiraceae bacterium]
MIKKITRKAAALLLTAAVMASATGCNNTTWVAKCGDNTYPAGLYLMQFMNESGNAQQRVENPAENIYGQTIDGVSTADWIDQETVKKFKRQIAIDNKFNEMQLSLTEEEKTTLNETVDSMWDYYSASYEGSGISKNSYAMAVELGEKGNKLFDTIYGEGGEKAVSNEELYSVFDENFLAVTAYSIKFYKISDMQRMDAPEAKEWADDAYARLMNGEDMYAVIADVEKAIAERDAADAAAKAAEEAAAAEETAEDEAAEATAEEAVTEETAAAEETVEETVLNGDEFDILVDKRIAVENGMDVEFLQKIEQAAEGEIIKHEEEDKVYLCKKLGKEKRDEKYGEIEGSLLHELKDEEFSLQLDAWAEELEIEFNEKSLKRYSAHELYKTQIEEAAEAKEETDEEAVTEEVAAEEAVTEEVVTEEVTTEETAE